MFKAKVHPHHFHVISAHVIVYPQLISTREYACFILKKKLAWRRQSLHSKRMGQDVR